MAKKKPTLKPILPNKGVEVAYSKALKALLAELHSEVKREIEQASKQSVAMDSKAEVLPADVITNMMKRLNRSQRQKIEQVAGEIAKSFATSNKAHAEKAFMASLKKAGFTVSFSMSKRSEQAYNAVIGENVGLIKSIGSEYLADVEQQVWQSVKGGHALGDLSKLLQERYDVSKSRAALIARDQNNKAKAVIEQARRLELGFTKAIWKHSSAGKKPRISHVYANGKEFDLEKGCLIDGEYILPGEKIGCRCYSTVVIPDMF